ncbi:MAG: MBL fold metallo-hydrolase [Planctomycetes bacterium]|nr:MBL fold metallo-hydrolase [Planctomycetota bacterium]
MSVIERAEFGPVVRFRVSATLLGRPLFFVHLFFVDGLLIDAGPSSVWRDLEPHLAALPVRAIALTHHHEDHSGNAARLAARFGCPVYAHPEAAAALARADWELGWYREIVWGAPAPAPAVRPIAGDLVAGRYRFRPLPTPGHSTDHVAFHEPDAGWLFTGDLFLHERVKLMRWDEDAAGEARSLAALVALPRARLFCGHHPRIWEDHREALGEKLAHFRRLAGRARELRGAGYGIGRIRRELLGGEGLITLVSRGRISKRHLVAKLLEWAAAEEAAGAPTGSAARAAGTSP